MRVAIPVDGEHLGEHFGISRVFALYDVHQAWGDVTPLGFRQLGKLVGPEAVASALHELEVTMVVVDQIDSRASDRLESYGITIEQGTPKADPARLMMRLVGNLGVEILH